MAYFHRNIYIEYHEKLLAYVQKKASLDLQGKALEMEQFYQKRRNEQQIQSLEGSYRQNMIVAGFIVFIVICILSILLIRHRNSRSYTQKLVRQIEEVIENQVGLIEEAENNERKKMAQNLHDDFAGAIASCVAYMRMLSGQFADNFKLKSDLTSIANMMQESYDKVRGKSHILFSSGDDNGKFLEKIEEQANLLAIGANINVQLYAELEETLILTEVKTTILLILKEAFTNIIKYSMASEVQILLYLDIDNLILEITDNGKGFSINRNTKTLGLKSIRDRTQRLNGQFNISSPNQNGVSINIKFPLNFIIKNPAT